MGARGRGSKGVGSCCFIGMVFKFYKMTWVLETNGGWGWRMVLHNCVLNATELYS